MLSLLSYAVLALSALVHVHAAPLNHDSLSVEARDILGLNATLSLTDGSTTPRFVVYSDQHGSVTGPPSPEKIKGFNI